MSFGLRNAPQIYQRFIDNALYGYLNIGNDTSMATAGLPDPKNMRTGSQQPVDVFIDREPDTCQSPQCLIQGLIR